MSSPWINHLSIPELFHGSTLNPQWETLIPGCPACRRSIPGLTDSGLLTRERPRVAALLNGVRKAKKVGWKQEVLVQKTWENTIKTPYFDILSWVYCECVPFSNLPLWGGIPSIWTSPMFQHLEDDFPLKWAGLMLVGDSHSPMWLPSLSLQIV